MSDQSKKGLCGKGQGYDCLEVQCKERGEPNKALQPPAKAGQPPFFSRCGSAQTTLLYPLGHSIWCCWLPPKKANKPSMKLVTCPLQAGQNLMLHGTLCPIIMDLKTPPTLEADYKNWTRQFDKCLQNQKACPKIPFYVRGSPTIRGAILEAHQLSGEPYWRLCLKNFRLRRIYCLQYQRLRLQLGTRIRGLPYHIIGNLGSYLEPGPQHSRQLQFPSRQYSKAIQQAMKTI